MENGSLYDLMYFIIYSLSWHGGDPLSQGPKSCVNAEMNAKFIKDAVDVYKNKTTQTKNFDLEISRCA